MAAFVLSPVATLAALWLVRWPTPTDTTKLWWLYSVLAAAVVVLVLFVRERRWWLTVLVWLTSVMTSLVGTAAVVFLAFLADGAVG